MARTTRGKPALEPFLFGDHRIRDALLGALAHEEREDRLTHGFHTYPAGLHPDAARDLVRAFDGEAVLDPFCGGGTVLVEARAVGRQALGRDVAPVALRVARMRAASPDEAFCTQVRSAARKLAEAARHSQEDPPPRILDAVREWYAPHALWELEGLRRGIAEADPAIRWALEGLLSSILVKVSWRKSDTSAKREKHRRPPGTTAILFHKKARELGRRWAALRAEVPQGTAEADIQFGDARKMRLDAPVPLIVTSPPYPSTYDYVALQHLRKVWLEDRPPAPGVEIGPRSDWREGDRHARKRWRADTEAWMATAASNLAPGGHMVIVIGDGRNPAGTIDSAQVTEEAAAAASLELVARASVERPDHARDRRRWEHAFAFRSTQR